MDSCGFRVLEPKSTVTLEGEIILIRVTWRSIRLRGMENSSSIHRGIAPPQGLAVEVLRSNRKVSIPPDAKASAAEEPAGPPPMTAARSFLPAREAVMVRKGGLEMAHLGVFVVLRGDKKVEGSRWVCRVAMILLKSLRFRVLRNSKLAVLVQVE